MLLFNKGRGQEDKDLWPIKAIKCLWGHAHLALHQSSVETELHSKLFLFFKFFQGNSAPTVREPTFLFSMGFLNLSSNRLSDLSNTEPHSFFHNLFGYITVGSSSFAPGTTAIPSVLIPIMDCLFSILPTCLGQAFNS